MIKRLRVFSQDSLNSPKRILAFCSMVVLFTFVLDGTLYRLWSLHKEKERLDMQIAKHELAAGDLDKKIRLAKSLDFIEHEARDRFDFVEDDELVFVFSDEE